MPAVIVIGAPDGIDQVFVSVTAYPHGGYYAKAGERLITSDEGAFTVYMRSAAKGVDGGSILVITQVIVRVT